MHDRKMHEMEGFVKWLPTFLALDREDRSEVLDAINKHNNEKVPLQKLILRKAVLNILEPPVEIDTDQENWHQAVS